MVGAASRSRARGSSLGQGSASRGGSGGCHPAVLGYGVRLMACARTHWGVRAIDATSARRVARVDHANSMRCRSDSERVTLRVSESAPASLSKTRFVRPAVFSSAGFHVLWIGSKRCSRSGLNLPSACLPPTKPPAPTQNVPDGVSLGPKSKGERSPGLAIFSLSIMYAWAFSLISPEVESKNPFLVMCGSSHWPVLNPGGQGLHCVAAEGPGARLYPYASAAVRHVR